METSRCVTCVVLVLAIAAVGHTTDPLFVNDYTSFSTFTKCSAEGIADGQNYYGQVVKAMMNAKSTIFITGWKIHPEIALINRGDQPSQRVTLNDIVRDAVKRGVTVYVLMWTSAWEKAQRIATKDYMNYRVQEGAQMLMEAGANVLIDDGHVSEITDLVNMRWSQHQKVVVVDSELVYAGGLDICVARWDSSKHDFFDTRRRDHDDGDWNKEKDHKPWHDVSLASTGDVARHIHNSFVARWVSFCDQWRFKLKSPPPCKGNAVPQRVLAPIESPKEYEGFPVDSECQATRTVGGWSYGEKNEESVLASWIAAIDQAQHFIYIEQQYLSSRPKSQNGISDALFKRLATALLEKKQLRVLIVLPWALEESHMVYPTQQTIVLYKESLVPRLREYIESIKSSDPDYYNNIDLEEWLFFVTLGIWHAGQDDQSVRLRALFVHSKLLMVDDRIINIGSANANDRSFYGERDSEMNVVVRPLPEKLIPSKMGGKPFGVGRAAHTFRMRLWAEHMGIDTNDAEAMERIRDPVVGFSELKKIALANSELARDVFDINMSTLDVEKWHDKLFEADTFVRTGVDENTWERANTAFTTHSHLLHYKYDTWGNDAKKLRSFMDDIPFLKELFLSVDTDKSSKSNATDGAFPYVAMSMVVGGIVLVSLAVILIVMIVKNNKDDGSESYSAYSEPFLSGGGESAWKSNQRPRLSSGGIRAMAMEGGETRQRKNTISDDN